MANEFNSVTSFSETASVDIQRSKFPLNHGVKLTFNVGDLVPYDVVEMLPGDTFQQKTSIVARMQTLLTPLMDNLNLSYYTFFVPSRILWDHFEEFMGANKTSPWIPQVEYSIPQISSPSGGWNEGTVADYMGIPTKKPCTVNALPFRAYSLIWNEFFRDENVMDPTELYKGDSTKAGSNGSDYRTDCARGGMPYKAAKLHDVFTSCLPNPQKGPAVTVPLGATAPVVTWAGTNPVGSLPLAQMTFANNATGETFTHSASNGIALGISQTGYLETGNSSAIAGANVRLTPNNLVADLSMATAANINQLRMAFQIQRYYEALARTGGGRYIEILKGIFGVTSPDYRLQRPEFVGGDSIPINIHQIEQTSATGSGSTPQGTVVGASLTTNVHGDYIYSATEHGYMVSVLVARYEHTYQQGLNRMWSRKSKFDFFIPQFSNIGEQAVRTQELYLSSSSSINERVFGYQEAWYDYRNIPNRVCAQFRSNAETPLDSWHLADFYSDAPTLSDAWMFEDKNMVDRALAVTSQVSHQLFADIFVELEATRPMPVFSIPGLIDHN